jgi:hypothetical protein
MKRSVVAVLVLVVGSQVSVACGSGRAPSAGMARSGSPTAPPSATATVPEPAGEIGGLLPGEEGLKLESYRRIDASPADGGTPIYVVGQDIEVVGKLDGMERVDVVVGIGARDTLVQASAIPDEAGRIHVSLHLPQTGVPYVVQGYGVVADPQQRPTRAFRGPLNEPVIFAGAFRVMAEP